MPILKLHPEHCIRQCLGDYSILLYCVLFWHFKRAAKLVFFFLIINLRCIGSHSTFQAPAAHQAIVFSHQQIAVNLLEGI